jgi:predicted aspartyl protease
VRETVKGTGAAATGGPSFSAMRAVSLLFACAAALLLAAPANAECLAAPELALDTAAGPAARDRQGRLVAPVTVNGEGPFRFIVDTGANRSALSRRLAEQLGLANVGVGTVHSIDGAREAPLVPISSLHYGELELPSSPMPLLEGPVLAGEQGLLGVDGMRGRRLRLDFERRCIEIAPSRGASMLRGWEMLRGELRFGHLVMIRGSVRGVRVNILIDTGSDTSIANVALQQALSARSRDRSLDYTRAYTAGPNVQLGSAIMLPSLSMGDMEIDNITAFVGDYHIFALWGLIEEPTLLIGMDVISQASGLAIDYERARVYFLVPDRTQRRWFGN